MIDKQRNYKAANDKLAKYYCGLLTDIGENPQRDGLIKTPVRAAEALLYLTQGYHTNLEDIVNGAIFEEDIHSMITVQDIEFYSLCEHHLLPFWGFCHIAYIPNGKIIGLSKLARIVNMFAHRLQVQERLTEQIASALESVLETEGIGVIIKAQHMCMMMRGVEKKESKTVTCSTRGCFATSESIRREFESRLNL